MRSKLLSILLCLFSSAAHAGLDVTAYEGLTKVKSPQFNKDGEPQGQSEVVLAPVEFVDRFAGLDQGQVYKYKASFDFRAGSYSGYNYWRNELAKLAGYEQTAVPADNGKTELRYDATVWKLKKGPFWELIDFSDAEGVIGPASCKRIYQDFLTYEAAASKHPDEYFLELYKDWLKAFSMCANNGAIVFS